MLYKVARDSILPTLLIIVLTAGVGLGLSRGLPAVQMLENWLADYRFGALASAEVQNKQIAIIVINEDTLATLPYRSPLDRGFLAGLIAYLDTANAAAIAIDILIDQPTEPGKDLALKKVLLKMKTPTVMVSAGDGFQLTPAQSQFHEAFSGGLKTGLGNLIKDGNDGTVRWLLAGEQGRGGFRPGFMAVVADVIGVAPPAQNIVLAYRTPPDAETPPFRTFPSHAVRFLPKEWFTNKIILIGADLPASDRHRTPFAAALGAQVGDLPGVFIHAHALAQMMDGRLAPGLSFVHSALITVALAVLGLIVAVLDTSAPVKGLLVLIAGAAYWGFSFVLFSAVDTMVPLISPTIALVAAWGGGVAYLGRRDRQEKRFVREAFSQYVAPNIVNQLISEPKLLKLGGERREMTFLFTDMSDFTALTERTKPEALAALLSEYMGEMLDIAFRHGATLDKLIGDAIVAFFNAPVGQPDHRARAVACALEMDTFGTAFVDRQAAKGVVVGSTRIGVHTGFAIVGNFGGNKFFDYTGLGDTVNTAARLESANKHLGTRVCISGSTASGCPNAVLRVVGTLILKGKSQGIEVYEPLLNERIKSEVVTAYEEAMAKLKQNDSSAAEAFKKVLAIDPTDVLAMFHLRRLESGATGPLILMEEK